MSIVLEETEESETEDTDYQDIEQVITATCTIGVDTFVRIQTVVETADIRDKEEDATNKISGFENENVTEQYENLAEKGTKDQSFTMKPDKKHVTFVNEPPTIINYGNDSQGSPEEKVEILIKSTSENLLSEEEKQSPALDTQNFSPCRKCKKKQQHSVRFHVQVGQDTPKERKSLFDTVFGWFAKYM